MIMLSVMEIMTGLERNHALERVPWHGQYPSEDEIDGYEIPSIRPFLLHETVRIRVGSELLQSPDQRRQRAGLACSYCLKFVKKHEEMSPSFHVYDLGRLLLPHVERCYALSEMLDTNTRSGIEWRVLGNLCRTYGSTNAAIGCFKLAFNTNKLTPTEHTQTALSLATIYYDQKDLKKSRLILGQIEVKEELMNDSLLRFRFRFARAATAARYEDSIQKLTELERSQDASSGSLDGTTLLCLVRLATAFKELGRLESAEALYRRVVTSYRLKYGPSNPATLEVVEEQADIHEMLGELDRARELYEESKDFKTAIQGKDHPNTAVCQARLASIYSRKYEFKEAIELYIPALTVLEKTLGKIHPSTIATRENYALTLLSQFEGDATSAGQPETLNTVRRMMEGVLEAKKTRDSSGRSMYSEEEIEESGRTLQEILEKAGSRVGAVNATEMNAESDFLIVD